MPSKWGNKADSGSNVGGLIGIFFMALTLAIVSFSCTGPILGSLLAGTLGGDVSTVVILGMEFKMVATKLTVGMTGFGLALGFPFAVFALFPKLLNALPQSGGWLNSVKVILGFLEVALAIKFLSNADLVEHWGLIKRETFFVLWFIIGALTELYQIGKIASKIISATNEHPTESRYISVAQIPEQWPFIFHDDMYTIKRISTSNTENLEDYTKKYWELDEIPKEGDFIDKMNNEVLIKNKIKKKNKNKKKKNKN